MTISRGMSYQAISLEQCEDDKEQMNSPWMPMPKLFSVEDLVEYKVLDPKLVKSARHTEIDSVHKLKVWTIVPRPGKSEGKTILKGRWVDINKDDDSRPNYRSRYMGKEIKRGSKSSFIAEFFTAMPPLQGARYPARDGQTSDWRFQ